MCYGWKYVNSYQTFPCTLFLSNEGAILFFKLMIIWTHEDENLRSSHTGRSKADAYDLPSDAAADNSGH